MLINIQKLLIDKNYKINELLEWFETITSAIESYKWNRKELFKIVWEMENYALRVAISWSIEKFNNEYYSLFDKYPKFN